MQKYNNKIETILTEDCRLIGTLKFNKAININGKIKGQINAPKGYILVGNKGKIEAEITINNIDNKGSVKGNINAINAIHIHQSSTIEGNINTKELTIEKGGQLNGMCSMKNNEKTTNLNNNNKTTKTLKH